MMNKALTKVNFKEQVLQRSGLSIVKFHADWSGPCQIMVPVYDQLSASYNSMATFYKVDIEKEHALKEQYGIMELPTVLFFLNGEVIDFITGVVSKNAFIAKLENNLAHINN